MDLKLAQGQHHEEMSEILLKFKLHHVEVVALRETHAAHAGSPRHSHTSRCRWPRDVVGAHSSTLHVIDDISERADSARKSCSTWSTQKRRPRCASHRAVVTMRVRRLRYEQLAEKTPAAQPLVSALRRAQSCKEQTRGN